MKSPRNSRADYLPGLVQKGPYPDVAIVGVMGAGATDGVYFRNAGIPTLAVSSIFMNPDDDFAHGLNERVPIKSFYDALDHWSIIIRELTGP